MADLHDLQWTPQKVKFFWNSMDQLPHLNDQYFTKQVGRGLLKTVERKVKIAGEVLDFGTGRGYLTELLLNNYPVRINVCDFSGESVDNVKSKFGQHKNFESGVHINQLPIAEWPENRFDFLFFIETVEHLLPEHYWESLKELHRLLKPGGHIVVTTPNNENLNQSKVLCPECGAHYHKFQHIRSYTGDQLVDDFDKVGFQQKNCFATNFWKYQNGLFSKSGLRAQVRSLVMEEPHLIYIGQKRS